MRTALAALAISLVVGSTTHAAEPFRDVSYKEALEAAKKEGKVVLLQVGVSWSSACQSLDKATWADEGVRKFLNEKTVAIMVDGEKDKAFIKDHSIFVYPTIILMKPDETEIDRIIGPCDAAQFLELAGAALEGRGTLTAAGTGMPEKILKDPSERLHLGREWEFDDKPEQALAAYLWSFDRGLEFSDSFYGVRRSFLLADLTRLGMGYPPARKALRDRRDAVQQLIADAMQAMKEGKDVDLDAIPILESIEDARAINRELHESSRTAAMFDALLEVGEKTAGVRKRMLPQLLGDFVEAKRYKVVMETAGDVPAIIQEKIDICKEMLEKPGGSRSMVSDLSETWSKELCPYFEAALATGDSKTAKRIAEKVLELHASADNYVALIEHAVRAENYKAARWLVKRGKDDPELVVRERSLVKRAGRDIPEEPKSKKKSKKKKDAP